MFLSYFACEKGTAHLCGLCEQHTYTQETKGNLYIKYCRNKLLSMTAANVSTTLSSATSFTKKINLQKTIMNVLADIFCLYFPVVVFHLKCGQMFSEADMWMFGTGSEFRWQIWWLGVFEKKKKSFLGHWHHRRWFLSPRPGLARWSWKPCCPLHYQPYHFHLSTLLFNIKWLLAYRFLENCNRLLLPDCVTLNLWWRPWWKVYFLLIPKIYIAIMQKNSSLFSSEYRNSYISV